jgi:GntR family transcriptional repressor for pyruvate dehydrogenase complex
MTLSMRIQNILQERIMNGTYPKGEYLPGENTLCSEFEVSRTTVRDAVSGLVEKGFLERQHGKGVLVIDRSSTVISDSFRNMMLRGSYSVAEFLETREMIEKQIAIFAAKRASKEQISQMENSITRMMENSKNMDLYTKYDLEFHKEIAIASKNHLLIAVYEAILPMLEQIVIDVVHATGTVESDLKYHSRILAGIKSGDILATEQAVIAHSRASEEMFRKSIPEDTCLDTIFIKNADRQPER